MLKCALPIVAALMFTYVPSSRSGDLDVSFKSAGAIDFRKDARNDDHPFTQELATTPQIKIKWYAADFAGRRQLLVGLLVRNTSPKSILIDYHVAFFDKNENLVAVCNQDSTFDANANVPTYLGACILRLSPGVEASISSYKVVVYQRDK